MSGRGWHWADRGEVVKRWRDGRQTFDLWAADSTDELAASIGWDGPRPGRFDVQLRDTIDGRVIEVFVHGGGLPVRFALDAEKTTRSVAVPWRDESLKER